MQSIGRSDNSFRRPRFAADDDVVSAKVEVLERNRHQREQRPVVAPKRIQERGLHMVRPYRRRNAIGIVEQREDVGIGELAAQRLDYFFTAPHLEKPVMDDR